MRLRLKLELEKKMNFYVYENWVAEKKAVIHRGETNVILFTMEII